ncbi:MAG: urease accessory UreF family protein [Caldilineaceae bacterium]
MSLNILRLLHLADSAFPIGATAHSFGLETLAVEGLLTPQQLQPFLRDLLWETGQVEALFGRLAYRCAAQEDHAGLEQWLQLNIWLAALKPARESREASATLGRRFLQTVAHLAAAPVLHQAQAAARQATIDIHYCTAFGLVGGALKLGEEATILAYLQQSLMGLVSACLRLLPIGQGRTSELLWSLQPLLTEVATASLALAPDEALEWELTTLVARLPVFTPLLDLASMRHPTLSTRLFIS